MDAGLTRVAVWEITMTICGALYGPQSIFSTPAKVWTLQVPSTLNFNRLESTNLFKTILRVYLIRLYIQMLTRSWMSIA